MCHGSGGGTVTVAGFPSQYSPNQNYLITIQRASGSSIANFNGSCRIGVGSNNAGTLAAGTGTATYNTGGETNGIHLSSNNQNSATFNWTAPASGTGTVRLYVAAHQGTYSGANTVLVQVADESTSPPGPATNPSPANNATNVLPDVVVSWTAGSGAATHDVYFGTDSPPPLVGNQTATQYDPVGALSAGTTYYWQIDERNANGVTPGVLWQFTVMNLPQAASQPIPQNSAVNISPTTTLSWMAGNGAASHDVYFGEVNPPPLLGNQTATQYVPPDTLLAGTTYYWQIDERNAVGVTAGELWQFTVMNLPQAATQPSPPDSAANVAVTATLAWTAGAGAATHELYFGTSPDTLPIHVTTDSAGWDPPGDMNPGAAYYWRVDERNAAGVTPGTVWRFTTEATAADEIPPVVASAYALGAAYPNPFNAVVTIPFALPRASEVRLSVYDLQGREVAALVSGGLSAGQHTVPWNGINAASGLYFVRLFTPSGVLSSKIVLLK
jgi:hypothetical protein